MSDQAPKPPATPIKPSVPEPSLANGESTASSTKTLSGAELKKLKQQEKAAKRAAQKENTGSSQVPPPSTPRSNPRPSPSKSPAGDKQSKPVPEKPSQPPKGQQAGPRARRASETRRDNMKARPVKQVRLFSHLYAQPRRHSIVAASKDIHPAVLALGLQMSNYEVCGSNARCVAMLLAFKEVSMVPSEFSNSKPKLITPLGTTILHHSLWYLGRPPSDTSPPLATDHIPPVLPTHKRVHGKCDPVVEGPDCQNRPVCERDDCKGFANFGD